MDSDEELQARARALSSPVRLRILRLCLHRPRTNKEIAQTLALNPATALHHVRTLLSTGFLAADEARSGNRGAREIPYRATGLSWSSRVPDSAPVLVDTFLQEIEGLQPAEIEVWRLGVRLNSGHRAELLGRLQEVLDDYVRRGPDEDGEATSIMLAHHPDRTAD